MKRIAVVTGASSGMGACFALQLAEESALFKAKAEKYALKGKTGRAEYYANNVCDEIWLFARREDRLCEVKAQVESLCRENGGFCPEVKIFALDISGSQGSAKVNECFEAYKKTNGAFAIGVLVNNAGFGTYGEFADTPVAREMEMVDLDCTSVVGITGYALGYMDKFSRIINTASLASYMPLGNFAVYGACKAFVLSFTVALAAELKEKGIRVTALCPGPVSTEFANVASNGVRKNVRHGLSAEKTVAHCLKKSRRGKLYSVMALKWKVQAYGSRFVGRYAVARFTYKFVKRPH